MLDPWIIEEILKKEEEARREQERQLEIRIERLPEIDRPSVTPPRESEEQRGVIVIDI